MYFPHAGLAYMPAATLYANKGIPSIYSRHVRQTVECFTSSIFAISPCEIRAKSRGRRNVAFARQVAMYLTHVAAGLPMVEVGRLFARDRSTVAHACTVVEDRRDDPVFDRSLDVLEVALRFAASSASDGRGYAQ